jgi:hypothetical protein
MKRATRTQKNLRKLVTSIKTIKIFVRRRRAFLRKKDEHLEDEHEHEHGREKDKEGIHRGTIWQAPTVFIELDPTQTKPNVLEAGI